jgi:hypothetical protein
MPVLMGGAGSGSTAESTITLDAAKLEFSQLSTLERNRWKVVSQSEQFQVEEIRSEAIKVLRRTGGGITWDSLASVLGGILSSTALRAYFTNIEDFTYSSSDLMPDLSVDHIANRMRWGYSFFIFWKSAKLLKRRVLLIHMDEKWFFAVVRRKRQKCIASLGIMPHNFKVRHKSHVHKTMFVAVTGCCFEEGDIQAGGVGVRVCLKRVCRRKKVTEIQNRFYNFECTVIYCIKSDLTSISISISIDRPRRTPTSGSITKERMGNGITLTLEINCGKKESTIGRMLR